MAFLAIKWSARCLRLGGIGAALTIWTGGGAVATFGTVSILCEAGYYLRGLFS